ncbi:MAG: carbohydrate kinase [Oscillospiraceae bacterium]|nr:carbohydrate kinase [Oscillospiraceae bacterium]
MLDVLSVGEALVDMTPAETAAGERCFLPKAGGAPVNVACALAKLGKNAAFAGRVGEDAFGRQLADALASAGVETALLQRDRQRHTTLAFVHLDEQGERSFSFCRKGMADTAFQADEKTLSAARESRIFHFGSVALAEERSRSAVLELLYAAQTAGRLISCDPNLRFPLWDDHSAMKRAVLDVLPAVDILKIAEEEAEFLFGLADPAKAAQYAQETFGARAVFVTCGGKGAWAALDGVLCFAPAYAVETVDTTGAGDGFCGAALAILLERTDGLSGWSQEEGTALLRFACAAGSLAVTRKGAIDALPTRTEVERCVAEGKTAE